MAGSRYGNGASTRHRILDVATELFTERGYDKTSLRDIAERLDITKATLYYYFAPKQDILLELHMRLHNLATTILDELEAIPDGPARSTCERGSSRHRSDLPAPARPDRDGSLYQNAPDRLVRHPKVLTDVVERPPVPVPMPLS